MWLLELKDSMGRTALYWASSMGRAETVRELLARGAVVGNADKSGLTLLYVASYIGHLEAVRALLARGAAVGTASDIGNAPLLRQLGWPLGGGAGAARAGSRDQHRQQ